MTPIRAIVGRFSFDFTHAVMENIMQKFSFEHAAIISSGAEPKWYKALPEDKQQWFDSGEIRSCTYEGVHFEELAPLDPTLIENMRTCEAHFMNMVQRQEWKYQISYETRKDWYFKHLRYWDDYITRHQINLYVSAWLPHEIPDIIIYHLCKLKNIPVFYFNTTTERDTAYLETDIVESAVQIEKRYEELLKEYSGATELSAVPLSPEFEERFRSLTQPQGQTTPLQTLKVSTYWGTVWNMLFRKPLKFLRHALAFLTPKGIARAWSTWQRSKLIAERNAFYNKHAINPDLNVPFVYLALHFQPEASTNPMAGPFVEQVLMAQMLNACLPDNVLIYVKEHPKESSWVCRDVQYYKDFLALSKVRLVSRETDTFALRENCAAVATATGSVGFEALFRGKPVFIFGYRFYQFARGVFRIRTMEDCEKAVTDIFEKHAKPKLIESRIYLKAMEDTRVHGLVNPWDRKVSHLSDEQHIAANTQALSQALTVLF